MADNTPEPPRKRKRNWSMEATLKLIEIWKMYYTDIKKDIRKARIYAAITTELNRCGISATKDEVHVKICNLRVKYRTEKRMMEKTGKPTEWTPYYKLKEFCEKESGTVVIDDDDGSLSNEDNTNRDSTMSNDDFTMDIKSEMESILEESTPILPPPTPLKLPSSDHPIKIEQLRNSPELETRANDPDNDPDYEPDEPVTVKRIRRNMDELILKEIRKSNYWSERDSRNFERYCMKSLQTDQQIVRSIDNLTKAILHSIQNK